MAFYKQQLDLGDSTGDKTGSSSLSFFPLPLLQLKAHQVFPELVKMAGMAHPVNLARREILEGRVPLGLKERQGFAIPQPAWEQLLEYHPRSHKIAFKEEGEKN